MLGITDRASPGLMATLYANITTFLLFVTLTLVLKTVWKYIYEENPQIRKLPGPWAMPLIGHFPRLGDSPHLTLTDLRQTYGDVFRIYLGNQPVVIVNGLKRIKEALGKQSSDFADRPDFDSFKGISDGVSLSFGRYGETWKAHRRIGENALKRYTSGNQLKNLEAKVTVEMQRLINTLTDNNNEDGHTSDPQDAARISTANIICSIAFGKGRVHSDEDIKTVVTLADRFNDSVGGFANPVDFMPWLRLLPNPKSKALADMQRQLSGWIKKRVHDHRATYQPNVQRDIMDNLLRVSQEMDPGEIERLGITEKRVLYTVQDIFGAGFDTLATCIHWALQYLVKNAHIQRDLQKELDEVIGRDRLPTLADRSKLPYTDAFVYEVLRHSTVAPFGLPHATVNDTKLAGFNIPKGTVVYFNLWSANHDPSKWPKPEQFRPERFLTPEGHFDRNAAADIATFSVGRRKCLGEYLAKLELFLLLAILIHQCEFKETSEGVAEGSRFGLSLRPRPFKVYVKRREIAS